MGVGEKPPRGRAYKQTVWRSNDLKMNCLAIHVPHFVQDSTTKLHIVPGMGLPERRHLSAALQLAEKPWQLGAQLGYCPALMRALSD